MGYRLTIRKRSLDSILVIAVVIYFFFYENLQAYISYSIASVLCCLNILLAGIILITRCKKREALSLCWKWIVVLIVTLVNNKVLENRLYMISFFNYFSAMIVSFALIKSVRADWISDYSKTIRICGLIFVFATLLFFILPGANQFQYRTWGYYPNGTEEGRSAYRAGLASSYSANGIYVAISLISIVAPFISHFGSKYRAARKEYVLIFASMVALLLTAKRAHLLFSVAALIITYFLLSKEKKSSKLFRFFVIGVGAILLFMLLCYFIPVLSNTFLRLFDNGGDISTGRFLFWEYAYKIFLEHPWFGIGWFGFRFEHINITYTAGYYDAHCIYIQLLCETGIIGFAIVVFALLSTWIDCVKLCRKTRDSINDKWQTALVTSACIQIFMIVYGLTGNVLYDRCFIIYMLSIAVQWAIKYSCQTSHIV